MFCYLNSLQRNAISPLIYCNHVTANEGTNLVNTGVRTKSWNIQYTEHNTDNGQGHHIIIAQQHCSPILCQMAVKCRYLICDEVG